ncbi:MAG TPA: hypothetical protein VMU84_20075 [Thermoanaerobaculia bacterium]|nr:hypothetical protein [Thermoanaerobaculia bacterium]
MAVPVSGSYRGFLTAPAGASQRLDLRIDVDKRIDEGSVLQRVSGDVFSIDKVVAPGQPPKETEVYLESWIMEHPKVVANGNATTITGEIRFWNAVHPKTTATIRIPSTPADAPAAVTIEKQSSPPATYSCPPAGKFFRALHLEVDVCKSVNKEPILPTYGTHSLKERPPDLTNRTLTIERAYGEAGIEMVIRGDKRDIIDDSAASFSSWSDAELHNAMEAHFSQYQGAWPKWEIWGLLAGEYDNSNVGGVMFDYAASLGGPGKAPERQGFAVFRKHFWFDSLVPNPKTDAELTAARKFLWCYTHESGHAFNLLHSWDKNRPKSLSWMNYDWKYASKPEEYWKAFRFRFDDEELTHIRHGNRPSVIMGGDPWSSGGHAEAPPGSEHLRMPPGAMTSATGDVPIDIEVSSQPYFEFLEPVSIELRARNLLSIPINVSGTLHPEFGNVTVYVRRPDGRIVEYMPISCKLAEDNIVELSPAGAKDSSDRHSRSIFLSYGRYGFYFDEPGQYFVRAVYHGPGDTLIPSNVHRLRVGHPKSVEADRLAQDYFSYETGAALYLGGSPSQYLEDGMNTLLEVVDRLKGSLAAAKCAARIAYGVGRTFHELDEKNIVRRKRGGDTKEALQLAELALKVFQAQKKPRHFNIPVERIARAKAELLLRSGNVTQARSEMTKLAGYLHKHGVKPSVTKKIEADAAKIKAPKAKTARRSRSAPSRKKR